MIKLTLLLSLFSSSLPAEVEDGKSKQIFHFSESLQYLKSIASTSGCIKKSFEQLLVECAELSDEL